MVCIFYVTDVRGASCHAVFIVFALCLCLANKINHSVSLDEGQSHLSTSVWMLWWLRHTYWQCWRRSSLLFLPCHCECNARSFCRLSVCLSVCLSNACIVTKRNNLLPVLCCCCCWWCRWSVWQETTRSWSLLMLSGSVRKLSASFSLTTVSAVVQRTDASCSRTYRRCSASPTRRTSYSSSTLWICAPRHITAMRPSSLSRASSNHSRLLLTLHRLTRSASVRHHHLRRHHFSTRAWHDSRTAFYPEFYIRGCKQEQGVSGVPFLPFPFLSFPSLSSFFSLSQSVPFSPLSFLTPSAPVP